MTLTSISPANAPDADALPALDLQAQVGEGWRRLPGAVQNRFAHADGERVYEGALALYCSPMGRVFAWAGALLGGPLTTACGDAPARVRVHGDGRGGVVWERHLRLAGHDKIVRSTKLADAHGRLIEQTDSGLSMELDVFEQHGVLVFQSRRYFFALAGLRIPIPALLTPGTCRVEHHAFGTSRFRFVLSMVHPWWGVTFRQSGVFHDPEEVRT